MIKNKDQLHQALFKWWREHGRVLPWRERTGLRAQSLELSRGRKYHKGTLHVSPGARAVREKIFESYFATDSFRDPYRVVVAEVMLQQTQVDRVKEKYEAWMKKWPTIEDLANATLAEVIIEWKGLGYNRRARFLWLLATEITQRKNINDHHLLSFRERMPSKSVAREGEDQVIVNSSDSRTSWPSSEKELLKLSGIGKYTARAVMSFAFGRQVGVVDTNVKRIFSRVFLSYQERTSRDSKIKEVELFEFADELLPEGLADPWNQALMDFGALICTVKNPKCEICPLINICEVNIEAISEGYKNYSHKLSASKDTSQSVSIIKKSKDIKNGKKIPFEQTDRYLRGRIIDMLRDQKQTKNQLIHKIQHDFSQFTKEKIETNLSQLLKEQMIQLHGNVYALG